MSEELTELQKTENAIKAIEAQKVQLQQHLIEIKKDEELSRNKALMAKPVGSTTIEELDNHLQQLKLKAEKEKLLDDTIKSYKNFTFKHPNAEIAANMSALYHQINKTFCTMESWITAHNSLTIPEYLGFMARPVGPTDVYKKHEDILDEYAHIIEHNGVVMQSFLTLMHSLIPDPDTNPFKNVAGAVEVYKRRLDEDVYSKKRQRLEGAERGCECTAGDCQTLIKGRRCHCYNLHIACSDKCHCSKGKGLGCTCTNPYNAPHFVDLASHRCDCNAPNSCKGNDDCPCFGADTACSALCACTAVRSKGKNVCQNTYNRAEFLNIDVNVTPARTVVTAATAVSSNSGSHR